EETLADGAETASISVDLVDTPNMLFGVDFHIGDHVTVQLANGATIVDGVQEVELTYSDTGREGNLTVGPRGEEHEGDKLVKLVKDLRKRIRALETRYTTLKHSFVAAPLGRFYHLRSIMAEATEYDKLQDQRLDDLESLITAEYQPPEGTEYSFPVANQGITQDQFRLMFLGQANGMIHGDNGTINDSPDSTGYRYYLEGHDSDSETNQRNTLFLRAGTSAESIVEGFYHRLTEDMELPFPAVTTTTVYHVSITIDPRLFQTTPLKIEVYPGEPPTSQGRIHLLLHTVERKPNQLLTQATITRFRQYTAGLLSVQN